MSQEKIRIAIVMDGGLIQHVITDYMSEIEIVRIDYDTEGAAPDDDFLTQDGAGKDCFACHQMVDQLVPEMMDGLIHIAERGEGDQ